MGERIRIAAIVAEMVIWTVALWFVAAGRGDLVWGDDDE